MTIDQALTLAKRMMNKHDELRYWNVTTNKRKSAFGVCNYTKRQIELSLVKVPSMTDEGILDTIYHEIAHALTPGHHHDRVWKTKYIELGGDGKRCHGADKFKGGKEGYDAALQKESKYTLTCPVCGYKYYRNRKLSNGVSHSCGKHNTHGFDPKYKLVVTQNY